jgi:hypothetical protein
MTAPAAAKVLFTSRSASYAVAANCPSGPLGSVCSPGHSVPFGTFPGYPGIEDYAPTHLGVDTFSYARLVPPGETRGNGSGQAYTESGSFLPTLKGIAVTRPNQLGRYATAYAYVSTLYAYNYKGAHAVPLPLIGTISADISFAPIDFTNPLGRFSFPYSYGQVSARFTVGTQALYSGKDLNPSALGCGAPGVLATAGNQAGRGGYASGGVTQHVSFDLNVATGCDGNPLTLHPHDKIYLYAFLDVLALQGGFTDASHSFDISFAPGTPDAVVNTVSADTTRITSVPEPASWSLIVIGFGVTGAAIRRTRRARLA